MKKAIVGIIVLFLAADIIAQDTAKDTLHNISVYRDARIDALVQKNREANEEVYFKTLRNVRGFRLQVINTNDRNSALAVKTRMLSEFPAEKTYLLYHSPYFKIQMGNFRTKEDAEELMRQVSKIYPSGVFIVPAKIEIMPSKDGEVDLDILNARP